MAYDLTKFNLGILKIQGDMERLNRALSPTVLRLHEDMERWNKTLSPAVLKLHEDMERWNKTLSPAALKLHEDMERWSKALRPAYLSIAEQMGRAVELRDSLRTIGGFYAQEALGAQSALSKLFSQVQADSSWVTGLKAAHQSWIEQYKGIAQSIDIARTALSPSIERMAIQASEAARLFQNLRYDYIENFSKQLAPRLSDFHSYSLRFASRYNDFAQSFQTPSTYLTVPERPMQDVSRDLVLATRAISVAIPYEEEDSEEISNVFVEIEESLTQDVSFCESLLSRVDPSLPRLYMGAREALYSSKFDRARHVLSSLRELWSHLLRMLAPDQLVVPWVAGKNELLHEGRPTRRARILFLSRGIDFDPLSEMLVADTQALIKMLDFFNRVHELNPDLTEKQLQALVFRTESWLLLILRLAESNIRDGLLKN